MEAKMDNDKKVNVAIVGLGFGKEFIDIYRKHPKVGKVGICARSKAALEEAGNKFGIPSQLRFGDFDEVLKSKDVDAVHIVTPILEHARQSLASLEAGKHTACTVPMATSVEELTALVKAKKRSGKVYMMMETAVYTREYLYAKGLAASGKLGKIQFVRGSHMQNMGLEGWPEYWLGFRDISAARHTRNRSLVGHLSRLRIDFPGPREALRLPLRRGDGDLHAEGLRRRRRGYALALRDRSAVP
jgi:predicted dehydrogenase